MPRLLADNNWSLWFLRLSGWPVFLSIVAAAIVFAAVASVFFSRIANRSAVQAMAVALIIVGLIGLALVALIAILSHAA